MTPGWRELEMLSAARLFLPPGTVLRAMQRPDNLIAFDWVVGWR